MTKQHSLPNGETVHSETPVLLVGAGHPQLSDIAENKAFAPTVVAADGGANFCLAAGVTPTRVIGDLDSLSAAARGALPASAVTRDDDQNLTDFEKALRMIEAPLVIALGFTEGRMDHTLANFAVLARRIGPPTLLLGGEDLAFAAPETLSLDLPHGTRLSLFPMRPSQGISRGLKWPIDGLTLDPSGRLGTSNEVSGPVRLSFDQPGVITLVPRKHLHEAMASLIG